MRIVTQDHMNRLFEVTDELGLDREKVSVPLEMRGEGSVERRPDGGVEIVLPDADDLGPFLRSLAERL